MAFLCYLVIFSEVLAEKLHQRFTYDSGSTQKRSVDLAQTTPVCLDRSDIPDEEFHWLYIPTNSTELATSEDYAYLSGQLIQTGVVNAADCPLGGLWPSGYANPCGLERTREVSLYLQNVYDDEILTAGAGIGVPPVMIKQLIRYESQFWPLPMGLSHFGLGHLTFIGAGNALIWSRDLFEATFAQAPEPKINLPNQLLTMMDASCPTCPLRIDIPKAEQSISYIAQALLGYCRQTSQVVFNATKTNAGNVVVYATIWKLTLLNYNAGPLCVYNAVNATYTEDDPLSWDTIAANIDTGYCRLGVRYAENITAPYYEFQRTP